ncbi:MAG: cation diffusion facilitator family transporter [Carboxydocellales bacterium]
MEVTAAQTKAKAARLSVVSNSLLVVGKLIAGISMGSVSVLSEAVHSGIDLVAALIAYFSVQKASEPADEEHPYGHGKIENVSGTIEAVLIFGAAAYIIYESIHKLQVGGEVEGLGLGAVIMGISAIVNWFISSRLYKVAKETDSVALEADALHLRTDVYTSLGVLIGLVAIKLTGLNILDPLVAIAVALLIIKTAWDLTKTSFVQIIDARLPQEEETLVINILEQHSGNFVEFHELRSRKSGAERFIDLHIVVPRQWPVLDVHQLCDHLEERIEEALPRAHVLIHIEPCTTRKEKCFGCEDDCPNQTK